MKRNSHEDETSFSEPEKKHTRTVSSSSSTSSLLDGFEFYIVTRLINDTSDESDEKNWKKIQCTELQTQSTPSFNKIICHMDDLDKPNINSIRVGFIVKNRCGVDLGLKFSLDGKHYSFMTVTVMKNEERIIKRLIDKQSKESTCILVKKNDIAEDEDDIVTKEVLDRLGTISVSIFRVEVRKTTYETTTTANSITNTQVKIKESMTKTKDLSIGLGKGQSKPFEKTQFVYHETLKTIEFVYHTKLGYLFELSKAGASIQQNEPTKEQSNHHTSHESNLPKVKSEK
ncbi:hypothetical protein C9374_003809 [Naegleria lovaniensis]|uniref:Uncharacterized protein n=1 Tax=Naegleria lovaniensis TaxID=51637 RepID=A0AA88KYI1_NAELO|nr:uncharacterized protein C9374_003809 [Naegleria lovaniensis]KAG2394045.1 hypothetical protein C9374_003809 [Naegleria lovaniensis]